MPFMIRFSIEGEEGETVVFGPFSNVHFQGEHLCLTEADMARLQKQYPDPELWDDTDYPPNCLASAQQTGEWWVQPLVDHFELMEIYSLDDPLIKGARVVYENISGHTIHFKQGEVV